MHESIEGSIIIPSYNAKERLYLNSGIELPDYDDDVEVVVIDNGSTIIWKCEMFELKYPMRSIRMRKTEYCIWKKRGY